MPPFGDNDTEAAASRVGARHGFELLPGRSNQMSCRSASSRPPRKTIGPAADAESASPCEAARGHDLLCHRDRFAGQLEPLHIECLGEEHSLTHEQEIPWRGIRCRIRFEEPPGFGASS